MTFFGRSNCDLQIPYKIDPNPWKQHQNWVAIERWATFFARNCVRGGGCLTATSASWVFDPTSAGAAGGFTARWKPNTAMNLVAVTARVQIPPSGDDFVVHVIDAFTESTLATLTFTDGVDDTTSWSGAASVTTSSLIYFQVESTASVTTPCIQAWFDGAAGGGLILYPSLGS